MVKALGYEKWKTRCIQATKNAKRYIDFASKNGIGALLIEGWQHGWENWFGTHDREGIFDYVTPYPDYDLNEVIRYAKEKMFI